MRDREDLQDRDTSVGRGANDRGGQATDRSAGRAAPPSEDGAIGLAGAPDGLGDAPATGIETGNATLGSSTNAAQRPDRLNTPKNDR